MRADAATAVNMLVRVASAPLAGAGALDLIEFVRTIAAARIDGAPLGRPRGHERGDSSSVLPRRANPERDRDMRLLDKLGLKPMSE
jgi:hypothetical protein